MSAVIEDSSTTARLLMASIRIRDRGIQCGRKQMRDEIIAELRKAGLFHSALVVERMLRTLTPAELGAVGTHSEETK